MPTVGVRELKNNATKIVRAVREEHAQYIVTVDGEPVAVLRPYTMEDEAGRRQIEVEEWLARLDALAAEIATHSITDRSAVELLSEEREARWRSLTQAS